jgi:hypothetical protein
MSDTGQKREDEVLRQRLLQSHRNAYSSGWIDRESSNFSALVFRDMEMT